MDKTRTTKTKAITVTDGQLVLMDELKRKLAESHSKIIRDALMVYADVLDVKYNMDSMEALSAKDRSTMALNKRWHNSKPNLEPTEG